MKRALTTFFVLIISLLFVQESYSQCNTNVCTALPPLSLCAEDACIMCDPCFLDGYQGQTFGSNTCDVPGPFCGSIENNQWWAFMAPPSGTVTFNFTVFNCAGTGNGSGIQAEVYSTGDCNSFTSVSNCWSTGQEQNGSVTAVNLQPYCTYYLMVDGWAGDLCEFIINTSDCQVPPSSAPITIQGPTAICPGAIVQYTMNPAPSGNCTNNSNTILWTGVEPLGTILGPSDGPTITVLWNNVGATVLNVSTVNICFGGNQSIPLPVTVTPIPPTLEEHDVCLGECVVCAGLLICNPGLTTVPLTSWLGCDSVINCLINPIAPVFTNLGAVTICAPQTITICGQNITTCGVNSIVCDNWQGCDSTVIVDLAILNPLAVVAPPGILGCAPGSTVTLDGTASSLGSDCLPNVVTTYAWTGPPGGLSGSTNTSTATAKLPGQYCLRVTHSRNGISCSNQKCVTVIKDNNVPQTPQISGPNNPCPNTAVQYTVTPIGQPLPTGYTWTTSNGTPVTQIDSATVEVTWPNSGAVQLCVTANNFCGSSNPACLNVNVATPPTATLSGIDTVCTGSGDSIALTIILTGAAPWTVGYTLNGIPQSPLSIPTSPHTLMVAQVGTYALTGVSNAGGCPGTVSGTAILEEYPVPTADLSGGGSICQGSGQTVDFTLNFTGTAPWTVVYEVNGNNQAPVTFGNNPDTLALGQAQAGLITLISVTDGNGCPGTVSGFGVINVNGAPTVSNIQSSCNPANTVYVITFNINGGDPNSYSVTPPNGVIFSNTFTSDPIPSGTGYTFTVTDANNCNPVILTDTVLCDCTTGVGDMNLALVEECGDGPVTAGYDNGHVFDGNDTLVFILHSGSGVNIVPPIIGTYTTPTVSFDPATMNYGTTYYLSAVVGDAGGANGVLLTDPCLAVAQGTPIVFYEIPTATLSGDPIICAGEQAIFAVNFTGSAPWNVTYDAGNGPQTTSGINANPYSLSITPASTTTVCLTAMGDAHCAGTASGCGDATVNTAVQVSPPIIECNSTGTGYTVSFTITGGDGASYFVAPSGNLLGGSFISNEIPDSLGFSFVVDDANSCGPKTVAQTEVDCSCQTSVGSMTSPAVEECGDGPVTVMYNPTNEVLDPNDVKLFILHTNSGSNAGTILATNTSPVFGFNPATMSYGATYFISAVIGNDDGAGGVNLSDPCTQVATGTPVTFFEIPTATLNGTAAICQGESTELQISFTGEQPWEVTLDGQVLSNITTPDITYSVSPAANTTYVLTNLSDQNCPGTVSGPADITINDAPAIVNGLDFCNPDTNTYTVSFDITGGDPSSYTIAPMNGSLSGSTFTSNAIASNAAYQYIVSDANGCGQDTLSGVRDCNCITNVGVMNPNMQDACINEGIAVPAASGTVLDPDDVILYYLHTGSGAQLGNVIATSNLPGFNFNGVTMTAGQTYYISAVAGTNNGSGGIDLSDFCLGIAPGTPVLWNPLPAVSLVASDAICAGNPATVTMTMNGTGPYNLVFSVDGNPQTASNVTSPYTFNLFPTADAVITMIAVTDLGAGCSSPSSETATVFVSQTVEAGTAAGAFEFCDQLDTTVQLSDMLTGADAGGTWTNASGNVIPGGNLAVLVLLAGTHTFTYEVTATPPCPVDQTTVDVVIDPHPVADAGEDQQLDCDAVAVTLGGPNSTPGAQYLWSGGNVTAPNNPTTGAIDPGTYTLTVTNEFGCTAGDEVTVVQNVTKPEPHVTISGASCFGKNDGYITMDSITNGLPPYLCSFDGGPFTQQKTWPNLSPGMHTIVIEDANGCERTLDFTIAEPEQVNVELVLEIEGNENIVQFGDSVRLVVLVSPQWDSLDAIVWTPSGMVPCDTCQEQWIHPTIETTFSIMVDENGCTDSDQVTVSVSKDRPVYVPNAFSPNNDGKNDIFYIFAGGSVANIRSFLVFNRWGETVWQHYNFQPNDPAFGWDGRHRGKLMDPAVFTWFAEVEFTDGRVLVYEGDVTLMR
ncbi:MAG: gliding motility-associated C-terminal domain-containing protein [Saprospiraceae bacterium]|nr:MAG: gliding motility-associated C-terminal domain-containing protein [Saprospiraceae bacterium]